MPGKITECCLNVRMGEAMFILEDPLSPQLTLTGRINRDPRCLGVRGSGVWGGGSWAAGQAFTWGRYLHHHRSGGGRIPSRSMGNVRCFKQPSPQLN